MKEKNEALRLIRENRTKEIARANLNLLELMKDEKFKNLYKEYRNSVINDEVTKEDFVKKLEDRAKEIHKPFDIFPHFNCGKCEDRGIINDKYCECYYKKLKSILTKNVGIKINENHTFDGINFGIYDDKNRYIKLIENIKKMLENLNNSPQKNLVLCGDTGVGKTYIEECIVNYLIKKEEEVLFFTAFELNNLFLKFHTTFEEDKYSIIDPIINCKVLIIDDLGSEPVYKNVTKEYLYLIINERQNKEKSTIVSTNLTPNGLLNTYGQRVLSRLFNKDLTLIYNLQNSDLRLKTK